jgi:hypothetical protein
LVANPRFQYIVPIWQTYIQPVGGLLLPLFVVTIVLSLFAAEIVRRFTGQPFAIAMLYLSPFAWLGGVTGLIAGASHGEGIVGAFVAGMLTVVAGLFSFIFAKDALSEWRPVLAIAVVLLCINAVIGLSLGGIYKDKWDTYERDLAKWTFEHEHIEVPALAVKARYDYCRKKITRANIAQCDTLLTK